MQITHLYFVEKINDFDLPKELFNDLIDFCPFGDYCFKTFYPSSFRVFGSQSLNIT